MCAGVPTVLALHEVKSHEPSRFHDLSAQSHRAACVHWPSLWTRLVSAKQYQRRAKQGPRVSMVYTLLNAYCTVGIDAPTDGDRVGCGPQVGYLGFNIPDGTDLPVG